MKERCDIVNKEIKRKLAVLIKYCRKKNNIKQEEIIKGVCSRKTYSLLENGVEVDDSYYYKFLEILSLEFDECDEAKIFEIENYLKKYAKSFEIDLNGDKKHLNTANKLKIGGCFADIYNKLITELQNYYINKNRSYTNLNELFLLKEMFCVEVRELLNNIKFSNLVVTEKKEKILNSVNSLSLITDDIFSVINEIKLCLINESYISAFQLCVNQQTGKYIHNLMFQANIIQFKLSIYSSVQSYHLSMIKDEIELFIKDNKERLPQNFIVNLKYQMGVIHFMNNKYVLAYKELIELPINVRSSSINVACMLNYMNFLNGQKERVEINEINKQPYLYQKIYNYVLFRSVEDDTLILLNELESIYDGIEMIGSPCLYILYAEYKRLSNVVKTKNIINRVKVLGNILK